MVQPSDENADSGQSVPQKKKAPHDFVGRGPHKEGSS